MEKAEGFLKSPFPASPFSPTLRTPDPKGSAPPKLSGTSFYVNFLLSEEPPVTMNGTLNLAQNSLTMINAISGVTSLVTLTPSSLNSLVKPLEN